MYYDALVMTLLLFVTITSFVLAFILFENFRFVLTAILGAMGMVSLAIVIFWAFDRIIL